MEGLMFTRTTLIHNDWSPLSVSEGQLGLRNLGATVVKPYGEHLMLRLSIIIGHLIHRNQNSGKMDFVTTSKIDQELSDCKNAVLLLGSISECRNVFRGYRGHVSFQVLLSLYAQTRSALTHVSSFRRPPI